MYRLDFRPECLSISHQTARGSIRETPRSLSRGRARNSNEQLHI